MEMDFKKELEKNLDSMISDLRGLLQIPSIAGEAEDEYPFGREVQKALEYMLNLGKSMGFEVKNVDNYGGHIDFPGSGEGVMALVGHIDVVPEGDGWTWEPFNGTVKGGWIYGRGVQDDKGPTMVALYVMKILKDLGFKPKKTIRLILGLDEESNWNGMKYYLKHEKAPDFGIVPDADFPLIQCEKGLLEFEITRANEKLEAGAGKPASLEPDALILESLTGGSAANVVAGQAVIRISGALTALTERSERIKQKAAEKEYEIKTAIAGGQLTVTVTGKPAHAAYPERGKNAISMAIDLLRNITFSNEDANRLVNFYNDKIGFALDGSRIGCAMEDDLSGHLTFNVGKINFDAGGFGGPNGSGNSGGAAITVDIRYPVTKSKEAVWQAMKPAVEADGFSMEELDHIHSIYQESDNPVVKTLLEVYRKISGDTESQPTAIGGATFARAIPNCMAFGPLFPGDPELEHQKNEAAELSQMLKAGRIYAEAVYRLTGV